MASTSKEPDKKILESHKHHDINNKMKMASNIVKACKLESQAGELFHKYIQTVDRTQAYTKAHQYLIYKCMTKNKVETSYAHYEYHQHKPREVLTVTYDQLREVYIDCYVKRHIIPTTQAFMKATDMNVPTGAWTSLNWAGFIHVRIPKTPYSMVIEKPEQARRRMEYLSKIAHYRSDERDIVYLEEKCVHPKTFNGSYCMHEAVKGNLWGYMCVVVSKAGVLHLSYFNDVQDYYKNVITEVIQKLKKPSVLVLEEKSHHEKNKCSLPTPHSTKQEMSAFLTINDIPHDPETSKAELYYLIQRSKNKCKTELYSMDEILKAYGHVLLRRPCGSDNLSFLKTYWATHEKEIEKQGRTLTTVKEELTRTLQNADSDDYENFESELINREQQMYTEDLQVEEIIDRLMLMAKYENISRKDFKQYGLDTQVDTVLDDILILDN